MPEEVVLRKSEDDGFEGTELETILAQKCISRIAVAGLLSEMCVSFEGIRIVREVKDEEGGE